MRASLLGALIVAAASCSEEDGQDSESPGSSGAAGSAGEADTDAEDAASQPCTGSREISSARQLDALIAEKCSSIAGDLEIYATTLVTLEGLQSIRSVGGKLLINNNPLLVSLNGLRNVASVGELRITSDSGFTSLNGLASLKRVTGDLWVEDTPLTSLAGLTELTSVGGLVIQLNSSLQSLRGLEKLTVAGSMNIVKNGLRSLDGLDAITSVRGPFTVSGCNALSTLGPALAWPADAIRGAIEISQNDRLPQCEVDALDSRQTAAVCGDFCFDNNGAATCDP